MKRYFKTISTINGLLTAIVAYVTFIFVDFKDIKIMYWKYILISILLGGIVFMILFSIKFIIRYYFDNYQKQLEIRFKDLDMMDDFNHEYNLRMNDHILKCIEHGKFINPPEKIFTDYELKLIEEIYKRFDKDFENIAKSLNRENDEQ